MSSSKVSQLIKSFQGFLKGLVSSNELTHNLFKRVEIILFYLNRYPLDSDKMESYSLNSNSLEFQEKFIKENQLDILIFGIKDILTLQGAEQQQDWMQSPQNNQIPELKITQNQELIKNFINNISSSTNKINSQNNSHPNIEVSSFDQTYQQTNQNLLSSQNYTRAELNQDNSIKPYIQYSKVVNNISPSKQRHEPTQQSFSSHIQIGLPNMYLQQNFQSKSDDLSNNQNLNSNLPSNHSIHKLDALINEISNQLNEESEQNTMNKSNSLHLDHEQHSNASSRNSVEQVKHSKQNQDLKDQSEQTIDIQKGSSEQINTNHLTQQNQQILNGGTQLNVSNHNNQKLFLQDSNYNYMQYNQLPITFTGKENNNSCLSNLLQDVRSNIQIMKSHTLLYQDLIREYHDSNRQQLLHKHQDLAGKYQYKFNKSEKQQHIQVDLKQSMKKSLKNIILYTRKDSRNASLCKIENDLTEKLQQTKNNLVNTTEKRQYINMYSTENKYSPGYVPGQQIESLSQRYMLNRQKANPPSNNSQNQDSNNSLPIDQENNKQSFQQNQNLKPSHLRQYHQTAFIGTTEQQQQIQQYQQQIQKAQIIQEQQKQPESIQYEFQQKQQQQQHQLLFQQQQDQHQQLQLQQQQPFLPQQMQIQQQEQIQQQLNLESYLLPQQSYQKSFEKDKKLYQTEVIRSPKKEKKQQQFTEQKVNTDSLNAQNIVFNNCLDNNFQSQFSNNQLIPPQKIQNSFSSHDLSYQQPEQARHERAQSKQIISNKSPNKQLQNLYSLESIIQQTNNQNNNINQSINKNQSNTQDKTLQLQQDPQSIYSKEELASPQLPKINQEERKFLDIFALQNPSDKKHFYIDDQKIY